MSVRGKRKLGIFIIVRIQILSYTFQICFFHTEFFCHETDDLTAINPAVQCFCNILRDFSSAAAVQSSDRHIDPVSGKLIKSLFSKSEVDKYGKPLAGIIEETWVEFSRKPK